MSNIPDGLLYTTDDEWIRVDGDEAVIGLTDYAQDALSDIVYVELPDEGESFESGETFGVVESVKAAADMYMPVGGEVIESNEALLDTPEILNTDPYDTGWMLKIRLTDLSELETLMDPAAYVKYCDGRG
ncbi:MAG TPA: glycine cleavage system protein GcvH [candidate division Zixibacteria bacterium]|nr:glycine cleavage system protein GcvH [candidate division Zixibacteria bacterium]